VEKYRSTSNVIKHDTTDFYNFTHGLLYKILSSKDDMLTVKKFTPPTVKKET
jgi:hypothetical protein